MILGLVFFQSKFRAATICRNFSWGRGHVTLWYLNDDVQFSACPWSESRSVPIGVSNLKEQGHQCYPMGKEADSYSF